MIDSIFDRGARWLQADFHLHTRADKEFSYNGQPNDFVKEYVAALKSAGVQLGVIANHNKFDVDEFKALRKAARQENIFLIPGVELSVNDGKNGIHVIVVFAEAWLEGSLVSSFLTTTFAGKSPSEYEQENGRSNQSLLETLASLEKFHKDFFFVFAHVEQAKGFLHELEGGRIKELGLNSEFRRRVLGFQKVRTRDLREKAKGWLASSYPAEVEGCDCKTLEQLASPPKDLCFLKIGAPTFEAVKFALLDHECRIAKQRPKVGHSYIKSVSFQGGILDGQTIGLSPELNTLIGIRGSGKSSVLEALRYALDLPLAEKVVDRNYKQNLVEHVLGSGGKVTVVAVDRMGEEYEIKRIYKESPEVFANGKLVRAITISETVLHKPVYFGQKDLSSTGEGFEAQLVDKLMGREVSETRSQIELQRDRVRDAVSNLLRIGKTEELISEYTSKKNDAEHRLDFYKRHNVEEKLQQQVAFEKDARYVKKALSVSEKFFDDLRSLIDGNEDDLLNQREHVSPHNPDFFADFQRVYDRVLSTFSAIKAALAAGKTELATLKTSAAAFDDRKGSMRDQFAEIERALAEELKKLGAPEAINVEEFKRLRSVQLSATEMLKKLTGDFGLRKQYEASVLNELSVLNDLWHKEFVAIQSALTRINDTNASLRIEVEFKGDRSAFAAQAREMSRGSKISAATWDKVVQVYRDFGGIYSDLEGAKALFKGAANSFETLFLGSLADFLTWQVPNRFSIKYRGNELQNHSIGQRATALILFVLGQHDNDVIVIDQPEDDLDNQTIYEDVIKTIRQVKSGIQFIFATHNANFPVLGDAEQVVACNYVDEKVKVALGSIDDPAIQTRVVDIMEGGQEAFTRRKDRYETWKQAIS